MPRVCESGSRMVLRNPERPMGDTVLQIQSQCCRLSRTLREAQRHTATIDRIRSIVEQRIPRLQRLKLDVTEKGAGFEWRAGG